MNIGKTILLMIATAVLSLFLPVWLVIAADVVVATLAVLPTKGAFRRRKQPKLELPPQGGNSCVGE